MDSWFLIHSLVYKDKIKVACWDSVGRERNRTTSQKVAFEDYKISREAHSSWVRIFYILKLGNKIEISFFGDIDTCVILLLFYLWIQNNLTH